MSPHLVLHGGDCAIAAAVIVEDAMRKAIIRAAIKPIAVSLHEADSSRYSSERARTID